MRATFDMDCGDGLCEAQTLVTAEVTDDAEIEILSAIHGCNCGGWPDHDRMLEEAAEIFTDRLAGARWGYLHGRFPEEV